MRLGMMSRADGRPRPGGAPVRGSGTGGSPQQPRTGAYRSFAHLTPPPGSGGMKPEDGGREDPMSHRIRHDGQEQHPFRCLRFFEPVPPLTWPDPVAIMMTSTWPPVPSCPWNSPAPLAADRRDHQRPSQREPSGHGTIPDREVGSSRRRGVNEIGRGTVDGTGP